jgi:hypothetical protein
VAPAMVTGYGGAESTTRQRKPQDVSVFEILMLICFGASWPISIAKSLRTRQVAGKSPLFLAIVIAGYASGILHKALYATDWVILLYVVNLVMVAIDLALYLRFSKLAGGAPPGQPASR